MGVLQNVITGVILLVSAVISIWTAGAIYFGVCGGTQWGVWVALGWVAGVIVLFVVWQPLWQPFTVLFAFFMLFLGWWLRQKPRQVRDWDPAVAVLPRAVCNGDVITIENVRNFEYRSLEDFTPSYETRTYHLENLTAVDAIFFNWGSAIMSHPVLVFDFGPDGRICISIEVRYQKNQKYLILRSLYHYYEIIFLVADERDAILRRTKFAPRQEAHLYRLVTTPEDRQATFLDYIHEINSLHQTPRWYNGLCMNCTTTFYRLPSRQRKCDWRVLANARLDRALYGAGRLDRSLSFDELRRCAYLTDIANRAPAEGFGDYLRRELNRARHDR